MPPKQKSKSRLGSAAPKGWEQELCLASLCEEGIWNASIALVVESRDDDSNCIAALANAIDKGTRKLFSHVSLNSLLSQVQELSSGAAKGQKGKTKDGMPFAEICDMCKPYIDAGEELPLPMLAQLIKFRLLMIKENDQKRREAEAKAASSKDALKGGKGEKNAGNKSPVKGSKAAGGAQKKGQDQTSPKVESKLKKRGETELESKFINDEPEDGPQHYVVLTGFYQPHLLTFLAEIGVSIDCIIRVEWKTPPFDTQLATKAVNVSASVAESEDEARKLQKKVQDLERFWRDILPIMDRAAEGSSLHDVARLSYIVDHGMLQLSPVEAGDAKVNQEQVTSQLFLLNSFVPNLKKNLT